MKKCINKTISLVVSLLVVLSVIVIPTNISMSVYAATVNDM